MKLLGVLALYQVVSARLIFLDKSKVSNQDAFGDMYSNLLSDINLDISFDSQPRDPPAMHMNHMNHMMNKDMNMNMNHMMNNDMNMNMNHMMNMNSMFSFPAFPSASSFFDTSRDDDESPPIAPKKPLYLLIESSVRKQPRSMFILEESSKVNGNTYRYTVKSDGNNPAVITESWSAPNTMYLCKSKSCEDNQGMQMMDIINHFDSFGQTYMHLKPSTTEKSELFMPMMPMMDDEDEDISPMHWMNHMTGNMRKGCNDRMKRISDWVYGEDTNEVSLAQDNDEIVFLDNDEELMDEMMIQQESDDIILMGMSCIMVILMVCGLFYAMWRCLAEKKEKGTSDHYVAMGESDAF